MYVSPNSLIAPKRDAQSLLPSTQLLTLTWVKRVENGAELKLC